jgi:uncharacterized cupin superfamily protein
LSWKTARLDDIETAQTPEFWQEWAREPDFGGGWHSIGDRMGIRGFGINASTADEGRELIVPHNELGYGDQEELYIVLEGRARFLCDGAEVELGQREILLCGPEVEREAVALATPTIVLCVGGTPDKPYQPDA